MKFLKYILTGILLGIVMTKSEAISWYRIQEMFRFQSFHMFGIIGTAVVLGIISVYVIKKTGLKDVSGQPIKFYDKDLGWKKYIFGGAIFGLGWALTGACPGPIFVSIGYGYLAMILVAIGAIAGTYFYGLLKDKLPH
ncbi:MAG: YeeE/YedE family protein [Pedobacter sp.]|nr:MAG: YeeE/YedE family protein [Pedobacter sp.]